MHRLQLNTEIARRDNRINELQALREKEIVQRTVLETNAKRVTDIEESLREVENKLQIAYERLAYFLSKEVERTQESENNITTPSLYLNVLDDIKQKLDKILISFSTDPYNLNLRLESLNNTASALLRVGVSPNAIQSEMAQDIDN